jgi:hypothetical protein
VTIPGSPKFTVALTPSNPQCSQQSAGLVCTLEVPAPLGTSTAAVATYASTDGTGTPLSTATVTLTVTAGTVNDINITLDGVVVTLALAISPSTLAGGIASTSAVALNAMDAAGRVIVGPGRYVDAAGNPLTITLSDSDTSGSTSLSQTTVTAPTSTLTLNYNGGQVANFTVSASAPGYQSATASVTVNTGQQLAYVGSSFNGSCGTKTNPLEEFQLQSGGGIGPHVSDLLQQGRLATDHYGNLFVLVRDGSSHDYVLRFPAGARGSAAPASTLGGPNTQFYDNLGGNLAVDSTGAIWVAVPVTQLYSGPPKLLKFAPGASGDVAPVQVVTGIAGMPPDLNFYADGLSVDSHDNVYTVAESNRNAPTYPSSPARVYELPSTANGIATPIGSYGFSSTMPTGGSNVKVNQHDDSVWVFPADDGGNGGIEQFSGGNPTPSRFIYGSSSFPDAPLTQINSAAFDDNGNVYVAYIVQHSLQNPCGYGRISTFGPSQNGNVTPLQNYVDQGDPYDMAIPVLTAPTGSGSSGTPSSAVSANPGSLAFQATGQQYAQPVTVSEGSYSGSFTASSANTAIVNVTPASSPGSFTITPVGAGSTTVSFGDANGRYTTVATTVTISALHLQGRRR